ncbi:MAG: hypothetical protein BWY66_01164 [bacterium ADurb.Bin374]|nr:MAG: hypothetical protein BWY66_01164 [bacterium ADurb.Bin374]
MLDGLDDQDDLGGFLRGADGNIRENFLELRFVTVDHRLRGFELLVGYLPTEGITAFLVQIVVDHVGIVFVALEQPRESPTDLLRALQVLDKAFDDLVVLLHGFFHAFAADLDLLGEEHHLLGADDEGVGLERLSEEVFSVGAGVDAEQVDVVEGGLLDAQAHGVVDAFLQVLGHQVVLVFLDEHVVGVEEDTLDVAVLDFLLVAPRIDLVADPRNIGHRIDHVADGTEEAAVLGLFAFLLVRLPGHVVGLLVPEFHQAGHIEVGQGEAGLVVVGHQYALLLELRVDGLPGFILLHVLVRRRLLFGDILAVITLCQDQRG